MKRLEKLRDELASKDHSPLCECYDRTKTYFKCPYHNESKVYKAGFDAATKELMPVIERLEEELTYGKNLHQIELQCEIEKPKRVIEIQREALSDIYMPMKLMLKGQKIKDSFEGIAKKALDQADAILNGEKE